MIIEDIKLFKKEKRAVITARQDQRKCFCNGCDQVILSEASFIHPQFRSMTTAFAECTGRLLEETTCEAVARVLKCTSKTLWDLDQHRMEVMMKYLKLPSDLDLSKSEMRLIDKLRHTNQNIHAGMLLVETFHKALVQKSINH